MKVNMNIPDDYQNEGNEIRDYAYRKIQSGLKNSKTQIDEVILRVNRDIRTGRRWQPGKCSVLLYIPGQIPVQVMKTGNSIYSAISKAVDAAVHRSSRRIRQRQQLLNIQGA